MSWLRDNFWLLLFVIWGLPLTYYRSKFRKIVYQTEHWSINVKPLFRREMAGLIGNLLPENEQYLKMRNFYRFYLLIYLLLMTGYFVFG